MFAMTLVRPNLNEARSKIVATVGPACHDEATMTELVNHGVDVFRINTAHGKIPDFERIMETIKKVRLATVFRSAYCSTWLDRRFDSDNLRKIRSKLKLAWN